VFSEKGEVLLVGEDTLIAAALLRKEGRVLLVHLRDPNETRPAWALPGGVVEPEELLVGALARVVHEQTGIEVVRVGDLIHVVQSHTSGEHGVPGTGVPPPAGRVTTFVFEVAEWRGEIRQSDPDGRFLETRFWPRTEAIDHLERHPSRAAREPILAYLRSEDNDRVWLYRRDNQGDDTLEWPVPDMSPEVNEQMRRMRALVVLGCLAVLAIFIIIVIIGVITLARPFV
jgi:ADP-ribose pyrophosphatase YjhB (NUDIX family)